MSATFWNRLSYERELWQKGLTLVAGVDEAGCGPLAGPVVAAAVVFPCGWLETGLAGGLRGEHHHGHDAGDGQWQAGSAAGVVTAALVVTVGLGLAGTLLALNQKPAAVLRNL